MIVVDTDVLSFFLIQGERTHLAQALHGMDPDWRAPSLWRAELVSVLNKHVRAKLFSGSHAREVLAGALRTFGNIDMEIDLAQVLNLAEQTGATTYDAHFLALAQQNGRSLVTGEKHHPGAPQGLAINIEDFLKAH